MLLLKQVDGLAAQIIKSKDDIGKDDIAQDHGGKAAHLSAFQAAARRRGAWNPFAMSGAGRHSGVNF